MYPFVWLTCWRNKCGRITDPRVHACMHDSLFVCCLFIPTHVRPCSKELSSRRIGKERRGLLPFHFDRSLSLACCHEKWRTTSVYQARRRWGWCSLGINYFVHGPSLVRFRCVTWRDVTWNEGTLDAVLCFLPCFCLVDVFFTPFWGYAGALRYVLWLRRSVRCRLFVACMHACMVETRRQLLERCVECLRGTWCTACKSWSFVLKF